MTAKMGRYRYWGDQKPDTSRPLLTFTRPQEAVSAAVRTSTTEQADATTTGTLRIYGPIDSYGGWWGVSSKEVAQALDMLGDAERIIVRVNSPGGESSEGRAIVNLLRAHKAEIVTVVDGAAYSAASYIAACGDDSVMSPGTTLMIHDTSTFFYGNEAEFQKVAATLGILSTSGAELYAEIAGGTPEQWRELQRAETWYTAATAVESGLMKRVATVPDAGLAETAGGDEPAVVDPGDVEERARASYDLSLFEKAPAPSNPQPPAASAPGSVTTPEGEPAMAFTPEQLTQMRKDLGLQADADEATIVAALSEAASSAEITPPATPQIPEGMSLVDNAILEQLKAGATAGVTAQATLAGQERDRVIDQALKDGKIAATSREKLVEAWDKDPATTAAVLETLTPGLVPTTPVGHESEPSTLGEVLDIDDAELAAFAASLGLSKEALRG